MRSVNDKAFAKVEGHPGLVRDLASQAIIDTDDAAFEAFQARRKAELDRVKKINEQNEEINTLRDEMNEMKQMLQQILSKGE